MHAAVASFVAQAIEHKDRNHGGPFSSVLEIGGRNVNGGVRSLFGPVDYVAMDLKEGPDVEIVADAVTDDAWDFGYDCIVCTNVLEHVKDWKAIIQKAHKFLAIGGWLIVTAPADPFPPHSGIDGLTVRPGEWYQNISAGELVGAVHNYGFEVEMAQCIPPDSMVVGVKR